MTLSCWAPFISLTSECLAYRALVCTSSTSTITQNTHTHSYLVRGKICSPRLGFWMVILDFSLPHECYVTRIRRAQHIQWATLAQDH